MRLKSEEWKSVQINRKKQPNICPKARYWQKEGTVCKIGINAKKGAYIIYPPPPVTGDLWKQGAYFKSAKYEGRSPQESDLMIYAVVDLASHPDFKKYFDLEAI